MNVLVQFALLLALSCIVSRVDAAGNHSDIRPSHRPLTSSLHRRSIFDVFLPPSKPMRAQVNDLEFNYLLYMAEITSMTYCISREEIMKKGNCSQCTMVSQEAKMYQILEVGPTRAIIGYMPAKKQLFISFRGSVSIQDWMTDADFRLTSFPLERTRRGSLQRRPRNGVKVHMGFAQRYESIRTELGAVIDEILLTHKQRIQSVSMIGHSLGGAIATLAALDLAPRIRSHGRQIELLTFGSPRVGDAIFVQSLESRVQTIRRFVEEDDVVVHMPPQFLGYRHSKGERYSKDGRVHVCLDGGGNEDDSCSNSRAPFLSINPHMRVLGELIFLGYACKSNSPFLQLKSSR